jgi:hypothetical protein
LSAPLSPVDSNASAPVLLFSCLPSSLYFHYPPHPVILVWLLLFFRPSAHRLSFHSHCLLALPTFSAVTRFAHSGRASNSPARSSFWRFSLFVRRCEWPSADLTSWPHWSWQRTRAVPAGGAVSRSWVNSHF